MALAIPEIPAPTTMAFFIWVDLNLRHQEIIYSEFYLFLFT